MAPTVEDEVAALRIGDALSLDDRIVITINGKHKHFISKEWLEGTDARGKDSVLAKIVLGTNTGLQGTSNIVIEDELVSKFYLVVRWLEEGNTFLQDELGEENASLLCQLASFFGLEQLENAITAEQDRRTESQLKSRKKLLITDKDGNPIKLPSSPAQRVHCVRCGVRLKVPADSDCKMPKCKPCERRFSRKVDQANRGFPMIREFRPCNRCGKRIEVRANNTGQMAKCNACEKLLSEQASQVKYDPRVW